MSEPTAEECERARAVLVAELEAVERDLANCQIVRRSRAMSINAFQAWRKAKVFQKDRITNALRGLNLKIKSLHRIESAGDTTLGLLRSCARLFEELAAQVHYTETDRELLSRVNEHLKTRWHPAGDSPPPKETTDASG